jgi:metal-responsive CopG/Arc/MetJ family transcriptional regulator
MGTKNNRQTISVSMDSDLANLVRKKANEENRSLANFIATILKTFVEEGKNESS